MRPRTTAFGKTGAPQLLAVLLLIAIAVRTAVPTGWMPAFDEQGITLVPCSPPADHAVHAAHDGADEPDQSGHDPSRQPCAFAAAAVDLPQPAQALPPMGAVRAIAPTSNDLVAIGRGLAAPPPPSTGPPLLA